MKKLLLGVIAVAGVALSVPANAQSVYFGFGTGQRYERPYYDNGYRSYDNGYRTYDDGYRSYRPRREYYSSYNSGYRRCRVVRVWSDDYGYRRVRRCW
jgi:hypothetical protein